MKTRDLVVVITGASSGIGRATAHAFATRKCALVLAARREAALQEVVRECVDRGGQAIAVPTDVSHAAAVQELARRAVQQYGRIDVWVNDAAVTAFGPFEKMPLEDFRRVLDVNLMGYVHGARAALPIMREQGRGVLINLSSIVGVVPQPYAHAYTISKFAIRALSGSLRQELRVQGVRGVKVCTVLPATIDTPILRHSANYTGRAIQPMPPVYRPQRVARTIVNLVRLPRREVTVGTAAMGLRLLARLTPGLVERLIGIAVDRSHLSRRTPAPDTAGNLYQPAAGTGAMQSWDGQHRLLQRAGTTALLLAAAAGGRRLFR